MESSQRIIIWCIVVVAVAWLATWQHSLHKMLETEVPVLKDTIIGNVNVTTSQISSLEALFTNHIIDADKVIRALQADIVSLQSNLQIVNSDLQTAKEKIAHLNETVRTLKIDFNFRLEKHEKRILELETAMLLRPTQERVQTDIQKLTDTDIALTKKNDELTTSIELKASQSELLQLQTLVKSNEGQIKKEVERSDRFYQSLTQIGEMKQIFYGPQGHADALEARFPSPLFKLEEGVHQITIVGNYRTAWLGNFKLMKTQEDGEWVEIGHANSGKSEWHPDGVSAHRIITVYNENPDSEYRIEMKSRKSNMKVDEAKAYDFEVFSQKLLPSLKQINDL